MVDEDVYCFDEKDYLVRMNKPIKNSEEILLLRSCLKDGMNKKEAKEYIDKLKIEVKNNHKNHVEKIKKNKKDYKKLFRKEFKKFTNN
jgi:hypothetical protein